MIWVYIWLAGILPAWWWMRTRLTAEQASTTQLTRVGLINYGNLAALFTALAWPVTVPLHLVGLIRKRMGLLTAYERNMLAELDGAGSRAARRRSKPKSQRGKRA